MALLSEHQREYWFSRSRADFLSILPRSQFGTILDLGCGAGGVTLNLSGLAEKVIGLDACIESLQILKLKAEREGQSNIFPVHATATELPFKDESVDLVLFNGVLERVGYAGAFSQVQSSQQRALAEAWRCLKPGGCLYLGIENRFGINYLLGARDEHTNLRYVNVLPRGIANLYSKLVRRQDFTAFTHSYWGLRRMMGQAGFGHIHFWCPLPTYRDPRLLVELEAPRVDLLGAVGRVAPHKISPRMRRLGALVPGFCWRYIAPHYSVVALK